jgi:phosphoribosylaminoimidazole-succinocarboxamide synthase
MDATALREQIPDQALTEAPLPHLKKLASGKVREIFDAGDGLHLLIVATDRLSAFDVVLPTGIPGKGVILTQLSLWWFERTAPLFPNHLPADHDDRLAECLGGRRELVARSMLVRRLDPLPLEAVVRGYLAGSGWNDYRVHGRLFEHPLPAGLQESARLPEPLFTPTTKATNGHDAPIDADAARELVGPEAFEAVREASLKIYALGHAEAERAGLLLADTKFEFGRDREGKLYLIDEVLTPDSSRYWPRDGYQPGRPQPAFDKQFVRDYLETLDWDKTAPGPELPTEVVQQTLEKYLTAYDRLVG